MTSLDFSVRNAAALTTMVLIVGGLSTTSVPAMAQEEVARYSLTVMGVGHYERATLDVGYLKVPPEYSEYAELLLGQASRMDLVVQRWSTPEERSAIEEHLSGRFDSKTVRKFLTKLDVVARAKMPGVSGLDFHYALKSVDGDKTTVLLIGSLARLVSGVGELQWLATVVSLELNDKDEGQGTFAPLVEPHIDEGGMRFAYSIGNPLNVVSVVTRE